MAESVLLTPAPRNVRKRPGFSASELGLMVKMYKDGLGQEAIAQRFGITQGYVSKLLSQFEDSTTLAKEYLRGNALKMAQNVVKKGRAVDHVAALKGLSVLHEEQSSGVTVIVGGGGTVNIGVLSPAKVGVESERHEK